VYEVGELDGQVFIVMELVEGSSMQQWQRAEPRGLAEVVRSYLQAARGLAAAHDIDIVHRDVKPANLLRGHDGRIRVADFGLARVLGESTDAEASASPAAARSTPDSSTELGQRVTSGWTIGGTPPYMAPETIAQRVADVRSDQFSWGVALFEAIYGRRPYSLPADARKPAPPILELARHGATGDRVPAYVRDVLRSTLQWAPEARLPSLGDAADALERGPLVASRRAQKWFGAGALGVTTLLSYIVAKPSDCASPDEHRAELWATDTATVIARNAAVEPALGAYVATALDQHAARWSTARHEACIAFRVLRTISEATHARMQQCLGRRSTEMRTVLDTFARSGTPVGLDPARHLDLLRSIEPCIDADLIDRDPTLSPDPSREEEATGFYATLNAARQALASADLSTALRSAAEVQRAAEIAGLHGWRAEALLVRGDVARERGDIAATRDALLAALDAAVTSGHEEAQLDALLRLAEVEARLAEEPGWAQHYLDRSLGILARLGRDGQEDLAWLLTAGSVEKAQAEYERANDTLRRALQLVESSGGDPLDLAELLTRIGDVLASRGSLDEADASYTRALDLRRGVLGPNHPKVVDVEMNRASMRIEPEYVAEAAQAIDHAYSVYVAVAGEEAPRLATILVARAKLELVREQWPDAIRDASRSLELQAAMPFPEYSVQTGALGALANALDAVGDTEAALETYTRLLALASGREPDAELAPLRNNIAQMLCTPEIDRCTEARPYYEEILASARTGNTLEARVLVAYANNGLAKADLAAGFPQEAIGRVDAAIRVADEQDRLGAPFDFTELRAEASWQRARAWLALDHPDAALAGRGESPDCRDRGDAFRSARRPADVARA
jgi:tetratricopeptide (TPR) repeat protein